MWEIIVGPTWGITTGKSVVDPAGRDMTLVFSPKTHVVAGQEREWVIERETREPEKQPTWVSPLLAKCNAFANVRVQISLLVVKYMRLSPFLGAEEAETEADKLNDRQRVLPIVSPVASTEH